MKTLNLTLSKKPFEVMASGEKLIEFRKPSKWIQSRLLTKEELRKDYDVVKFVNGYGKDKPFFTALFLGFDTAREDSVQTYSNGLKVTVNKGDVLIYLGDIIQKGNIIK